MHAEANTPIVETLPFIRIGMHPILELILFLPPRLNYAE